MQPFEDTPTSQHWVVPAQAANVTYEHVLVAAGELRGKEAERVLAATPELVPGTPEYYRQLLYVLTNRRYAVERAKDVWLRILRHRDVLSVRLSRNPGIAVAALDYLTNVEGGFARATLIDESKLTRLVDSATRDTLTGLYHRAVLRAALTNALAEPNPQVSVIMLDIDHFKRFNDSRGHLEGDRVLVAVASIVQQSVRDSDLAVRFGGEEFCVVLPAHTRAEALTVAERLRRRIADELASEGVTASLGVASSNARLACPSSLLAAADGALYASKRGGRNRVTAAD